MRPRTALPSTPARWRARPERRRVPGSAVRTAPAPRRSPSTPATRRLAAGPPHVETLLRIQKARPYQGGGGVLQLADGGVHVADGEIMLAGTAGDLGRMFEQGRPSHACYRRGVGHPIPQLERTIVVTQRVGHCEHRSSRVPGRDGSRQRRFELAGGEPVLGHRLGNGPPARWSETRLVGERHGQRPVELLSLTRQQVVVDGLSGERVPKDVPIPGRIGDEEVVFGQFTCRGAAARRRADRRPPPVARDEPGSRPPPPPATDRGMVP